MFMPVGRRPGPSVAEDEHQVIELRHDRSAQGLKNQHLGGVRRPPRQMALCHSAATIADATAVLSSFGWEGNASRRVNSRRSSNMLSAS